MKKILITGGAGLIGSNLARRMVSIGFNVVIADNLWRGKLENLMFNNIPLINLNKQFFNIDLRIYENCINITKDIDVVFI
jgi:nucleoside-diphosphate-sugar epimerase